MLKAQDNEDLTRVGPGTIMGDYLRRFWTPILEASELPGPDCDPAEVRILGENLVAFRDSAGQLGLLQALCPHRQAPLFYGRNEEGGLRCIYHGWKFDITGRILDLPNEPPDSPVKNTIRAKSYPVREWGGVVWAYLGPADKQPEIPQLEWGTLPPSGRQIIKYVQRCNWVQALEGDIDSSHVSFLHTKLDPKGNRVGYNQQSVGYVMRDKHPKIEVVPTDYGLMIGARRDAEEDSYYWRISQWLLPYYTLIGGDLDGKLGFGEMYVPIDDTHTMVWCPRWSAGGPFTEEQRRRNIEGPDAAVRTLDPVTGELRASKANHFLQDRLLQRNYSFSGILGVREQDTAVAEGMGAIVDRTQEHLVQGDAAIVAMRRTLLGNARALRDGEEPPAAAQGSLYRVRAWSAILPRTTVSFTQDPKMPVRLALADA
jgi:nitrite reductase/ring-hydroxylating ferredoxin subunit